MNKISKLLITAAFAVGMVALGAAQAAGPKGGTQGGKAGQTQGRGQGGPGGPGMRRGGMMMGGEVEKRLKLTADQKKKIEALMKANRAEMEKLTKGKNPREMTDAERKAWGEKMKPIREKQQAAFKKILTPAQVKEYDKMMAEMRARFQNGGGRPGGPGGGAAGKAGGAAGKGGTAGKGGKGGL